MSAKATFWAWEQAEVSANNKLVLLCYAQFANDRDMSWPGKGTVSRQCGVSKPTVKRSVKWLCEHGYMREKGSSITRTEDDRTRATIRYELGSSGFKLTPVERNDKEPSGVTVNRVQNEPGSICRSSGVTVNPNPINKDKPISNTICSFVSFDTFWDRYPRKTNRVRAEASWVRLKPDKTLFEKIARNIQGRLDAGDWDLARKDVIPHATTYLNNARWDDEIIPRNSYEACQSMSAVEQVDAAISKRAREREETIYRSGRTIDENGDIVEAP